VRALHKIKEALYRLKIALSRSGWDFGSFIKYVRYGIDLRALKELSKPPQGSVGCVRIVASTYDHNQGNRLINATQEWGRTEKGYFISAPTTLPLMRSYFRALWYITEYYITENGTNLHLELGLHPLTDKMNLKDIEFEKLQLEWGIILEEGKKYYIFDQEPEFSRDNIKKADTN